MSVHRVAVAMYRRDLQVALSYRFPFLLDLLGAWFFALTLYFIAKVVDPTTVPGGYFPFAILGVVMGAFVAAGIGYMSGGIRQEQMQGSLETLLAAGMPPRALAMGMSLYPLVYATVVAVGTVLIAALLGARAPQADWPVVVIATALGSVAFVGLGLIGVASVLVFKRGAALTAWVIALLALAAGELFPTYVLPSWARSAGRLSPYTQALALAREAAFEGRSLVSSAGPIALLVCLAVLSVIIGVAALSWALSHAKRTGSLGGY